MQPKTPFDLLLVEPLETVIGETLQHIYYTLFIPELSDFDVNMPNMNGVVLIRLVFDKHTLEVISSSERELRPGNFFGIRASLVPIELRAEHFCLVCADASVDWSPLLAHKLVEVEVIGIRNSPQSVRLTFACGSIVIAIGDSNDVRENYPEMVGDGPELLVLSDYQFQKSEKFLTDPWVTLWQSMRQY